VAKEALKQAPEAPKKVQEEEKKESSPKDAKVGGTGPSMVS
jgi:hypothetical protein